ncbi:GLPGLI family protein [Empedobacter stercoris]|uniref:GLPGLI family protein n=1 Tax=Empedobacter stercoris TaxID=1628248 RepID=UPI0039EB3B0F
MKNFLTLIIIISSFAQAQVYEVKVRFKHHTKYTSEYIEKVFSDIKNEEQRKWNIEQNENPKPIDFLIYSSKNEQNSVEQEKINNDQNYQGEIKKSVVGLPLGVTYSDFRLNENYKEEDVYGKKYIVKNPIEELVWEYSNETKEILGYKVYKATSDFKKYKVEAWYTKEIDFDFMPINVKPIEGFVLEMNLFVESEKVGRMDNIIRVEAIQPNVKKYKFKNPLKADKASKLPIVSQQEIAKIYDEANKKRNEMYNNTQGIDKK